MKKRIVNLFVFVAMSVALAGCSSAAAGEVGTDGTVPEPVTAAESIPCDEAATSAGTTAEENAGDQDNDMGDTISAEPAAAVGTFSDEEATAPSGAAEGNEQEQDVIKNYSRLKDLLSGADCLVKAEVLDAETKNVRSYIYTSYTVEVVDTLYGEVQGSLHSLTDEMRKPVLTVNLPGGTMEGEAASAMQKEVTEGKDAGNLPDTDSISSDGNTDRLLQKGDVAYLFLMPETEDAYAVVGEYEGVAFVEDNKVILNAGISDTGHELTEADFVSLVQKLMVEISKKASDTTENDLNMKSVEKLTTFRTSRLYIFRRTWVTGNAWNQSL